jgi:hypothetical protein
MSALVRAMRFDVPPSMPRRDVAMLAPYSSGLLATQWDFGHRSVLSCRHDRFDFPKICVVARFATAIEALRAASFVGMD